MAAKTACSLFVESHADLAIDTAIDILVVRDALLLILLPVLEINRPVLWRALLDRQVLNFLEPRWWHLCFAGNVQFEVLHQMQVAEVHECLDRFCVDGFAVLSHEEHVALTALPALGCPAEISELAGVEVMA